MTELTKGDEEIMRAATVEIADETSPAEPDGKAKEEPLELGSEEAPKATPEQVEAEKEKKRSHSPLQRINQLTARLREAERRAAELEARTAPAAAEAQAPDPNDAKYEFGSADPNFIKDAALFEVRKELADERKAATEKDQQTTAQREAVTKLNEGIVGLEKTGAEKYDDFADKIAEAVEAREGQPLPPLISIGIAVSPAGADIAYRLATDEAASEKIEKLAATNPQAAAVAFGELEGEYVDGDDDLNLADPLDMARMLGRMKSRLAGKTKPTEIRTTKAPKPAERTARGSSGQFEVGDDTDDFRAFERKYVSK